jgi:hypothetical protein
MAEKTPKEIKEQDEKAEQEYKDKKDALKSFKQKMSVRPDRLADMAIDIEKRGINHEQGLKGEIADKLLVLKALEAKRNSRPELALMKPEVRAKYVDKYKIIIEELEKELK